MRIWRWFKRKAKTIIVPDSVEVIGGRLELITDVQQSPRLGLTTKVFLDGKELTGVMAITLRIACNDIVTATVEFQG